MRSRRVSAATTWRDLLLEQGTCRRGAGRRVQLAPSPPQLAEALAKKPGHMHNMLVNLGLGNYR